MNWCRLSFFDCKYFPWIFVWDFRNLWGFLGILAFLCKGESTNGNRDRKDMVSLERGFLLKENYTIARTHYFSIHESWYYECSQWSSRWPSWARVGDQWCGCWLIWFLLFLIDVFLSGALYVHVYIFENGEESLLKKNTQIIHQRLGRGESIISSKIISYHIRVLCADSQCPFLKLYYFSVLFPHPMNF